MSPEALAELMAKYHTVELIRAHLGYAAGRLPASSDPFARDDVPDDVLEAVRRMAGFNLWVILSVSLDPANELPTGVAATGLLRSSFDPDRAVFTFLRRSRASPLAAAGHDAPRR